MALAKPDLVEGRDTGVPNGWDAKYQKEVDGKRWKQIIQGGPQSHQLQVGWNNSSYRGEKKNSYPSP